MDRRAMLMAFAALIFLAAGLDANSQSETRVFRVAYLTASLVPAQRPPGSHFVDVVRRQLEAALTTKPAELEWTLASPNTGRYLLRVARLRVAGVALGRRQLR